MFLKKHLFYCKYQKVICKTLIGSHFMPSGFKGIVYCDMASPAEGLSALNYPNGHKFYYLTPGLLLEAHDGGLCGPSFFHHSFHNFFKILIANNSFLPNIRNCNFFVCLHASFKWYTQIFFCN